MNLERAQISQNFSNSLNQDMLTLILIITVHVHCLIFKFYEHSLLL